MLDDNPCQYFLSPKKYTPVLYCKCLVNWKFGIDKECNSCNENKVSGHVTIKEMEHFLRYITKRKMVHTFRDGGITDIVINQPLLDVQCWFSLGLLDTV